MKIKTIELQGAALDWAVAKCEGFSAEYERDNDDFWVVRKNHAYQYLPPFGYLKETFFPSTEWSQGGPIIERELFKIFRNVGGTYSAQIKRRIPYYSPTYGADIGADEIITKAGPTMLIAAMRCYVAASLGDTVDIPEELI